MGPKSPKRKGKTQRKKSPEKKSLLKKDVNVDQAVDDDFIVSNIETEEIDESTQHERMLAMGQKLIESLDNEEAKHIIEKIQKLVDHCQKLRAVTDEKDVQRQDLQNQLDDAEHRVQQTLNVALVSENSIQQLQLALENTWRELDASRSREQVLQSENNEARLKVKELEGKVRKPRPVENQDDNADFGSGANKRELLIRERDRLRDTIEELELRLRHGKQHSEHVEQLLKSSEATNESLVQELENENNVKSQLERKIQDFTYLLEKSKDSNAALVQKIEMLESQVENHQKQITQKTADLEYVKKGYEKLKSEQSSWSKSVMKTNNALNACTKENKTLKEQLETVLRDIKDKEIEIHEVKRDYKASVMNLEILQSRHNKMTQNQAQLSGKIVTLKNGISILEKTCSDQLHTLEAEKLEKTTLVRDKNILNRTILTMTNAKKDLDHMLALRQMQIGKLRDDIVAKNLKLDELTENLGNLTLERDRNLQEIVGLNKKSDDLEDTITKKNEQIAKLKHEINELKSTLMKTKQLMGSLNSEQLKLRQNFQEVVEEKDTNKTILEHVNKQVVQLKEEVATLQKITLTLNLNMEKKIKENLSLKTDIQNKNNLLNSVREELKKSKKDRENLQKNIADLESRLAKETSNLANAVRENRLVETRLQERINEIGQLKENVSILDSTIQKGELQYKQRQEDIRVLKLEIENLRCQKKLLARNLTNTQDVKQEVAKVHRTLLQERVKNSTLQKEMTRAVNVHRWRRLKGRDPKRLDLIRKNVELQKHVLSLKVNLAERDKQVLQSHEMLCLVKNYVENLPNCNELKSKLLHSKKLLEDRSRKLKALTAELNAKSFEKENCLVVALKKQM